MRILTVVALFVCLGFCELLYAADAKEGTPANFVAVTDRLHTSGQPLRTQLEVLKDKGYALVINLATPASAGAVADEGMLVAKTGASYLNIPVDFRNPPIEDFDFFSNVMRQAGSRRVLVHCQVNKRASVFVFLYRVVHEGVAPTEAWRNVATIWAPEPQWEALIRQVLKRYGVAFDPF